MASSHTTLPTPNPSERSLLVQVEESIFADNPDILPVEGTRYEDCDRSLFAHEYNQNFNDYIYTGQAEDHGLLFAKGKTAEEANTPFRSSWKRFGNHRWCPVLEGLAFIEDAAFPVATNVVRDGGQGVATAPRNYVREIFIQEVNEGSRFLLDEFFGPTPYKIGRYPVPQPGSISYQMPGFSPGGFPECLHDDIEIPAFNSTTATYIGGTESSSDGRIPGQFFPRTNFRARRPYVLSADQVQRDGGWYMQRLRVFPPRQPRTTVQ